MIKTSCSTKPKIFQFTLFVCIGKLRPRGNDLPKAAQICFEVLLEIHSQKISPDTHHKR